MNQELLQQLPAVDILTNMAGSQQGISDRNVSLLTDASRQVLGRLRREILEGTCAGLPDVKTLCRMVEKEYLQRQTRSLRPVINATGVLLHTNLGRSILSEEAAEAAKQAARCYSTLEYRLSEGGRGSRYEHVEKLLLELCGGEAAMVVNNNAAAVMMILTTMAAGRSVVISRGELVEIGGSFRVPEIMEMSGCHLVEVGATNKTRRRDYEKALDEDTAALLKVHASNFRITGFTQEVSLEELVKVGQASGLPVIYDMGSGSIVSVNRLRGVSEPNAAQALKAGADVVCFSGDKLLGGPQAGIIIGRKCYVDAMKSGPLARALRVDKMTLAALEVTLRQYRWENPWEAIPTLRMLNCPKEELEKKRGELMRLLSRVPGLRLTPVEGEAPAGGGSIPGVMFPGVCVGTAFEGVGANELEHSLRMLPHPIVARIQNGLVLLDVRTVQEDEMELILKGFMELDRKYHKGSEDPVAGEHHRGKEQR